MKRLCIIDTFALMFRAFYAIPDLKTQTGLPSSMILGMSKFILQMLSMWKPEYMIAVIDMGKPTFRHEISAEYKANREEAPDDFKIQIDHVFRLIKSFGIPILGREGFEADDLAGTLCKKIPAEHDDVEILCITGDQDYFQLVNDRVRVVSPQIGFHKLKLYDVDGVIEKLGVRPDQVIDFKSLQGDSSDNIAGVPGVGKKTAAKLLNEYETLECVLDNIDKIKGKLQENIIHYKGKVIDNKELVTILTDIPLDDFTLEQGRFDYENIGKVEPILFEYDCFSSVKQLKAMQRNFEAGGVATHGQHIVSKKTPKDFGQISMF